MKEGVQTALDVALEERTISKFQFDVYSKLLEVPEGKLTTYGSLAKAVNSRCPQAVGQALKKNPFAPEVPCHRVIQTNLCLGGFKGSTRNVELQLKVDLLRLEGIELKRCEEGLTDYSMMIVEKSCLFQWE